MKDNTKIIIDGYTFDLATAPHMLIGGTTGSGKSNLLHFMINQITTNIFIIDPKFTEFNNWNNYDDISVFNTLTSIEKFIKQLHGFTFDRLETIGKYNCKDIEEYNSIAAEPMQRITVIIDEFHLILKGKITRMLTEIVTVSRAVGIHFIFATQKPTAQNTNSTITSQCNYRIALNVATASDSRVIIGSSGAELLKNKGDLILKDASGLHRLHCPKFKY